MHGMPELARSVLLRRVLYEPALTELIHDVRILTGIQVLFAVDRNPKNRHGQPAVEVPVRAGSIELGRLIVVDKLAPRRAEALQRWLEAGAESLAAGLSGAPEKVAEALPGVVARAASILRSRFHEPLTLGIVAKETGVSRERLSRLFRSVMGVTFSDYLNTIRLDSCRQHLVETHASITEIAFACGFQSVSQFNRRFKAAEGVSPREYRRRHVRAG